MTTAEEVRLIAAAVWLIELDTLSFIPSMDRYMTALLESPLTDTLNKV